MAFASGGNLANRFAVSTTPRNPVGANFGGGNTVSPLAESPPAVRRLSTSIVNSNPYPKLARRIFFAVALLLAALGTPAAESGTTNWAALGQLMVTSFNSAPFPHPARAEGKTRNGEFFSAAEHYSDRTVAMFIPNNFRRTNQIDFVVHFHGWNNTVAGTLAQFQLIEQFAASGKNAVLIVPEGPRLAPDSFGGKLEDTNGFKVFMAEAMEKLGVDGAPQIGSVILSGHSGGYHVMAAIVDRGGLPIAEAWLFDALYGGAENFVAWQKKAGGRLLNLYTDHGGTKDESEKLMSFYQTNGVSIFTAEDTHAGSDNLRTNKIIFLHTDLSHYDVVAKRGTFGQFLQSSCLQAQ